ncbi:MAG: 50S ribosomal protein L13 [Candidatus Wildermuthbacteria bacterium]|nr:50S ribosomal protein L13 [Candidatus Wildermuthbacteria bacterium]
MIEITRETHTIDAGGKALGRVAVQVATLLRGKQRPDFAPYKDQGGVVVVKNVGKLKFTGNKYIQKRYFKHTGYLGSIHSKSLKELFSTRPTEVLRKAVMGMMPKNKLRDVQIKRLQLEQ